MPGPFVDACLDIMGRLPFVFLGDIGQPVRVVAPPLRGALAWHEAEGGLRLTATITTAGGEAWPAPEGTGILRGTRGIWLVAGADFYPVLSHDAPELLMTAAGREVFIPDADIGRFLTEYLPRLRARTVLELPPRLAERVVEDLSPRPILALFEEDETLVLDLQFAYGDGPPEVRAGDGPPELVEVEDGEDTRCGRALRLPEEWLNEQRRLLAEVDEPRLVDGRLRLRRHDLALAGAWLDAADNRQADDGWRSLSALLRDFRGIPEAPPPASLRAELRPYQRRGYDWLCFLRDHGLHGILADDMGRSLTS